MKQEIDKAVLQGVHVPIVTPMDAHQNLDLDRLSRFADHLISQGVHALIPLGSTGEYYALDHRERTEVLQTVLNAADGRVPVLAGTNAASTRDVIAYSCQAEEMGAAGLLLAAPYYSLPTPRELFEHFRCVNESVNIPIMLYNYPGRTGVDMTPDLVERLADLSHVEYIKESTGDITRVHTIMRRCGDRIKLFCGADTVALESLLLGAVGWVGGIANVLPRSHVTLYDLAVRQTDLTAARTHYFKMLPALSYIENSGIYTQLVKTGCDLQGHPAGPPRAPLLPVAVETKRRLEALLRDLD